MIKKIMLLFCALIFCAPGAHATTIGSGSFTLIGPSSLSPYYNYGNRLFGRLGENIETSPGTWSNSDEEGYLNASQYTGSVVLNDSILNGTYDPTTGNAQYDFSTTFSDPLLNGVSFASVDFYASATFTGVLDEPFGYDYNYTGYKSGNNSNEKLSFTIQFEISYEDSAGETVYVYSDYRNSAVDFRTNWVKIWNADNGTYTGSRRFDYSNYGEQSWRIRYDFMATGSDSSGSTGTNPVPEPATIVLFGIGLACIGGSRLRKMKKQ